VFDHDLALRDIEVGRLVQLASQRLPIGPTGKAGGARAVPKPWISRRAISPALSTRGSSPP